MTEPEVLFFLRELAYLPLLGNEKTSIFVTGTFPETTTFVFLLNTEFGGETFVLTSVTAIGYNKLMRYLKGQEPFFKIQDETVCVGSKGAEFDLAIGSEDYKYKLTAVLTPDKERFLKAKELGLNLQKNALKQ